MLYIGEIVKYITSKSNCSKWRKLHCQIRKKEKKRFLFKFFSTPTRLGFSAPSSIVVFMYFNVFLYSAA